MRTFNAVENRVSYLMQRYARFITRHTRSITRYVATAVAAIIGLTIANGCHNTVDSERIPFAPVRLELAPQGIWDTYIRGFSFGQGYYFLRTGNRNDQLPKDFPYTDLSYTGFGGLLLVADLDNLPLVYDLACPVERKQSVRVVYNPDTQLATCPECKSQYNVCEHSGSPVSGPAHQRKWGLKRYTARPSSLGGYILAN